jgi:hypothetical protein
MVSQNRNVVRIRHRRARPSINAAKRHQRETLTDTGQDQRTWTAVRDWVAVIVPPTTLVTALAFWFGYTYTSARTFYLGIDASILEFSVTDYLVRSAEPVIVPAAVLLSIFLTAVGAHSLVDLCIRTRTDSRLLKVGSLALCVLGCLSLLLGLRMMFVVLPGIHYLVPQALLGGGAASAGYGYYSLRTIGRRSDSASQRRSMPLWEKGGYVVISLLVVLSLFWATTSYAGALGRGRAQALEQNLSASPSVVLYTKKSLAIAAPVVETRLTAPDSEYGFRYSGLRFIAHTANKYFLFPDGWTRAQGTVVVLEDTPEIRLEFKAGR